MDKYFNNVNYKFGDIISVLIKDLYSLNKYQNILFVRTCTTGSWLDNILIKNNINRILYYTDTIKEPTRSHKLTTIIHSRDLESHLISLNKTFDLICMDTYHEYSSSLRDFNITGSLLNESGILISHDCYPWNQKVANPCFIPGEWCGQTYLAFVRFAYNNPTLFYTILNTDTGIGIASKKYLQFLSNTLDTQKQEHLFNLQDPYTYFIENSRDIINARIN